MDTEDAVVLFKTERGCWESWQDWKRS